MGCNLLRTRIRVAGKLVIELARACVLRFKLKAQRLRPQASPYGYWALMASSAARLIHASVHPGVSLNGYTEVLNRPVHIATSMRRKWR